MPVNVKIICWKVAKEKKTKKSTQKRRENGINTWDKVITGEEEAAIHPVYIWFGNDGEDDDDNHGDEDDDADDKGDADGVTGEDRREDGESCAKDKADVEELQKIVFD